MRVKAVLKRFPSFRFIIKGQRFQRKQFTFGKNYSQSNYSSERNGGEKELIFISVSQFFDKVDKTLNNIAIGNKEILTKIANENNETLNKIIKENSSFIKSLNDTMCTYLKK